MFSFLEFPTPMVVIFYDKTEPSQEIMGFGSCKLFGRQPCYYADGLLNGVIFPMDTDREIMCWLRMNPP